MKEKTLILICLDPQLFELTDSYYGAFDSTVLVTYFKISETPSLLCCNILEMFVPFWQHSVKCSRKQQYMQRQGKDYKKLELVTPAEWRVCSVPRTQ